MTIVSTLCIALLVFQDAPGPDLVQAIELQRGGRHWIDQPTDPPKTPEESAACIQIEPGFKIELVACEPIVRDPVAIDFDHKGRMFVVEYGDYPVGPKDPNEPPLSQVVLLEDENSDGKMDKRTVYAPHLKFCHSLLAFRDGVLACTETQIMYLADTDGDNVADVREVWFDGFIPAHPQMQIGCPRYGFDNWIYLTYGHGKVRCTRPGFETTEPVEIPRVDFRFHPETMKFEAISGAGQFGNTIDNFGRRYFSSNRNPIMTDVLSMELVQKNPFAGVSVGHTDVGPAGEKTRVYPIVTMKSNWLSHAGTHTSACGVTAYRGGLFGAESDTSVFVCEPVGHLVTRSVIEPMGGTVTARRAREKDDFLASSDTWFRPVSLATGPDGALYLADMYRLWVEHPKFVPDDVAAKMDWRAGEDKGRIWRIVPEKAPDVKPFVPPTTTEDLVKMLGDGNGWRRMLAQRLLVEGKRVDAEKTLRSSVRNSAVLTGGSLFKRGPLHSLWTLHGLNLLNAEDLQAATSMTIDGGPIGTLNRDAVKLIRLEHAGNKDLQANVSLQMRGPNGEARMQAILAYDWSNPQIDEALLGIAGSCSDDIWLQRALLIAAPNRAADFASAVVHQSRRDASTSSIRADFLRQLALNVAVRGDVDQLKKLTAVVGESPESGLWWQTAIVIGLADGLPRCQNADVPKSLAAFLQTPPAALEDSVSPIEKVVQLASETAVDKAHTDVDRIAAMGLMSHLPPEALTSALETLLKPGESTDCQRAAIDAARRSGRAELSEIVLAKWDQMNPQARSAALDLLLLRKESITSLLAKMATGAISSSVVSIDQRLILLQHPDETIRTTSTTLFGGTVSANRKEVAEQYAKALELKGRCDSRSCDLRKDLQQMSSHQ